jgi:ABC-type nitrate/sulfonate/bicarbonate transport system permease component
MRNRYFAPLVIASMVALWELGARQGILSPLYFPAPSDIVGSYRARLGVGVLVTVTRGVCGYAFGVLIAYAAHFVCVRVGLDAYLDAQVAGVRAVPVIAVLPLFVIWFGFGEGGRVLIVVLATMGFYLAPLHEAYRLLPRQWAMIRRQRQVSDGRYYWSIVVPATLPALMGSLRVSWAIAFTMAIASDYVGAQVGIGVFLNSARITFNVPAIMLAMLVCSGIGILIDGGLMAVFRRCVPWAGKQPKL